jgi:hypothetical protein
MNEEFDWNIAPTICELNGFRWVLGPEAPESMSWDDATEWCKSVGGVLPPRAVLFLAYLNEDIRDSFANASYWSSSENYSNNAWFQYFNNGNQNYYSKNNTYLVRAVRAIKIGEE